MRGGGGRGERGGEEEGRERGGRGEGERRERGGRGEGRGAERRGERGRRGESLWEGHQVQMDSTSGRE